MAENKKDSFTFSDKIKNSKPAFNPFSKRVSSKIGNNGKPKKTLFERTRRDAPFFVAAAAALLMLPFLYKYSGSVEDGEIITPGTDSVFEPDRSGFDPSLEDPSAQIAQLSVRDPLSLIKGWGDPEPAPSVGSYDRDGMDDTYTPPARSYRNESPYRQQAPAASRAAFQRQAPAPTKVGKLGSASMNLRGGGGGFGRFGGANLKTAAKASSAAAPKAGVKPVSLQPLRAAGNPSRSYFGQGSAAQARASRDAMGKANALQALTDAMYDPLKANQAPLGGLGGGDFVGGAGAGKWDPHSEYKGITPWWWDMMKQQEMEKWKWKYFLWRKNLVEPLIKGLVDGFLVPFLTGSVSCIFTATDDVSMGNMGAIREDMPGSPAGCKIQDETLVTYEQYCQGENPMSTDPEICVSFDAFKAWCKSEDNAHAWDDGVSAMRKMSYWGRVRNCFNNAYTGEVEKIFGDDDHKVQERSNCDQMANHSFILAPGAYFTSNDYDKYYHIVIAKNVTTKDGKKLCEAIQSKGGKKAAGVTMGGDQGSASRKNANKRARMRSEDTKNKYGDNYSVNGGGKGYTQDKYDIYDYEGEGYAEQYADHCVIYWAEGRSFNYEEYKALLENAQKAAVTEETGKQLHSGKGNTQNHVWQGDANKGKGKGVNWAGSELEEKLAKFEGKIIPVAIEGYVMKKDSFPGLLEMRKALPMMYKDFIAEYVAGQDGGAAHCDWSEFDISAHDIINLDYVAATLTYGEEVNPSSITVTLDILADDGTKVAEKVTVNPVENNNQNIAYKKGYVAAFTPAQQQAMAAYMAVGEGEELTKFLIADWKATQDDKSVGDQATYRGKVVVGTDLEVVEQNPQGRSTVTSANVSLLSRDMADIPAVGNERNPSNTSGTATKYSSGTPYAFDIKTEDKNRLDSAFVGSQAAIDYVNSIITKYNAKVGTTAVQLARSGEKVYPTLPEFVDAMNIAKTYLGEAKVGKGIVCDMARGIAFSGKDDTPVNSNKRNRSTGAQASQTVAQNTFGAFAIYMGDGHLFPTQLIRVNGEEVQDLRFDCIKNGYYICTPDYTWRNYVNSSTLKASTAAQADIAKATKTGSYSEDPKDYPLGALHQGPITGNDSVELRASYAANFAKVFGEGDTCKLEGDMEIADALKYVELVTKNGLDFKPKASNKVKGDAVGGQNVTRNNPTSMQDADQYRN